MNGEGIPNDIMLEAFGSMAMFATNTKATIEDWTEGFDPENYREVTTTRGRHRERPNGFWVQRDVYSPIS